MSKLLPMMIAVGSIAISISACADHCENKSLSSVQSPDQKKLAILFERSCGATTPFLRIVTISNGETSVDFENAENWVMVSEGQSRFAIQWENDSLLKINVIDVADIKMKKESLQDFAVTFGYGQPDL